MAEQAAVIQLKEDIREQCVVEYLTKISGQTHESFHEHEELARAYCRGEVVELNAKLASSLLIQGLMLDDQEAAAAQLKPEMSEVYARSDRNQVRATHGMRNLEYFKENGVNFTIKKLPAPADKISYAAPLSITYLHSKIITSGGFEGTGANYVYHDTMDHLWLTNELQKQGLQEKYADYFSSIGDPFQGSLLSREGELISGIGYTSRRFYTNPVYFGAMGVSSQALLSFLESSDQSSVRELAADLSSHENALHLARFIVRGTIANLVTQRERMGAVKQLVKGADGQYASTAQISSLFDDKYIGLICDSALMIDAQKDVYLQRQRNLNYLIEVSLQRAFVDGVMDHVIHLAEVETTDASQALPERTVAALDAVPGFSTKHI